MRKARRAALVAAYLSAMNPSYALLSGADLAGVNLSGTNLSDTEFVSAGLARANLEGNYLSRTELSGANLSGAKMSGAVLTSAHTESVVRYQGTGKGGKLVRRVLSQSDLTGATVAYKTVHKERVNCMKHDVVIAALGERMDRYQTI